MAAGADSVTKDNPICEDGGNEIGESLGKIGEQNPMRPNCSPVLNTGSYPFRWTMFSAVLALFMSI
ncbi:hypothetical protein J27TS7_56830 [Paenibacillus dendritiformis]|nr:hypothetical protein J27TS7_56830 [Paenibacillus dendritiformis]